MDYTPPQNGGGEPNRPIRINRKEHGDRILSALNTAWKQAEELIRTIKIVN